MRVGKLAVLILYLLSLPYFLCLPALAQDGSYARELQTWRDHYVAELTKPDGWLSLAGLEWLQPGDNSFGSAGGVHPCRTSRAAYFLGWEELKEKELARSWPSSMSRGFNTTSASEITSPLPKGSSVLVTL